MSVLDKVGWEDCVVLGFIVVGVKVYIFYFYFVVKLFVGLMVCWVVKGSGQLNGVLYLFIQNIFIFYLIDCLFDVDVLIVCFINIESVLKFFVDRVKVDIG